MNNKIPDVVFVVANFSLYCNTPIYSLAIFSMLSMEVLQDMITSTFVQHGENLVMHSRGVLKIHLRPFALTIFTYCKQSFEQCLLFLR